MKKIFTYLFKTVTLFIICVILFGICAIAIMLKSGSRQSQPDTTEPSSTVSIYNN